MLLHSYLILSIHCSNFYHFSFSFSFCLCRNDHKRIVIVIYTICTYLRNVEGWGRLSAEEARIHTASSYWDVKYIVTPEGRIGFHFIEGWCTRRTTDKIEFTFTEQEDTPPLEEQTGEIIYRLFVESGKCLQLEVLEKRRRKRKEAEEARARKLAPYIEAENKKVKNALADAESYRNAVLIREYADAYYKKNGSLFVTKPEIQERTKTRLRRHSNLFFLLLLSFYQKCYRIGPGRPMR